MTNYIKGKTALITGATSGIGEALAYDLVQKGADIVLHGRDMDKLEELKKQLQEKTNAKIYPTVFDVRDKDAVADEIEKVLEHTNIDILINNAGLALGIEPIDQGSTDNWDMMIDTNLKGLLYVSKAVIPQMRDLPIAHIINLGSVAGKTAYPGGNVYCATKAAVHSLTDAMNSDLFGTSIKVGAIAPGAVETNFTNVRFDGDKQRADAVYEGYTPLSAADISSALVMMLDTPPHVNIQYMDIMPTAQRNPFQLYRDEYQNETHHRMMGSDR